MKIWRWVLSAVIVSMMMQGSGSAQSTAIRYVALGDSYTIGTGVPPQQAWPVVLTRHLSAQGFTVELFVNLARNGWTTQDVLARQVPMLASLKPNFVTILIGANDVFRGDDKAVFARQFNILLDSVQNILPAQAQVLILTIPDFSVTPAGLYQQNPGNVRARIAAFNDIIVKEAKRRGLKTADFFKVSQRMRDDPALIADGLHPSGKAHAMWEKEIFPTAFELIQRLKPVP
jgi:acyl-CoA thioesterase I